MRARNAGEVRNRRAFETHEAVLRRKRLLVHLKAEGAEETLVGFEDAIGAQATISGSVADVVEDPAPVSSATTAMGMGLVISVHL